MYCKICGDENNVKLRGGNRGVLCDTCAASTPRKAGRASFDAAYWGTGDDARAVPEGIKREFYDDYRASEKTLEQYIEATTSATM